MQPVPRAKETPLKRCGNLMLAGVVGRVVSITLPWAAVPAAFVFGVVLEPPAT